MAERREREGPRPRRFFPPSACVPRLRSGWASRSRRPVRTRSKGVGSCELGQAAAEELATVAATCTRALCRSFLARLGGGRSESRG